VGRFAALIFEESQVSRRNRVVGTATAIAMAITALAPIAGSATAQTLQKALERTR
jgi:hypothetical protein